MPIDKKSTYYDQGSIETIDIIQAKLTPVQFRGYLLGNIIKYACRMEWKGYGQRDCEKIIVYSKVLRKLFKKREKMYNEMVQDAINNSRSKKGETNDNYSKEGYQADGTDGSDLFGNGWGEDCLDHSKCARSHSVHTDRAPESQTVLGCCEPSGRRP